MPTKEEVMSFLKAFKEKNAERYSIERLGMFGSYARDDATVMSDLDIVVKFRKPDLFNQAGIMLDINERFGIDVDVIALWDRMNPRLKKRIERDAIYV